MAVPVMMAKVGWGTEPVTLVEWKANEGEQVEKASVILAITTGKIESEVEAEASGFLHIIVNEGVEAEVGSIVGQIAETQEELEKLQKEMPPVQPTVAPPVQQTPPAGAAPTHTAPPTSSPDGRIRISPVARKMAEENMIDVSLISGTGPGGRIVREDIEKAIQEGHGGADAPTTSAGGKKVKSIIPLRGMRGAIAENMFRSLSTSAQLTVMGEIDMAGVVRLREKLLEKAADEARVTYTELFVYFISRQLKEHPVLNSSIEGKEIVIWEDINIGIAVALDEGLIVPVIKNADKKSLSEISRESKSLVEKARNGKLVPEDITGGTFTITNLGAVGGGYRFETVITNPPEAAILGTGGISDRVVAMEGQIVIRPVMTYYLTYDHRAMTGAMAAAFMADLKKVLESEDLSLDPEKA